MTPTDFTAISRTQFFKDDPLGKVILADGMISVGEIMAYFYPLFIQKLDNLINNTEILPFEVTNILDPTKTDEDKWKDIQKNNVTIPEIMLIYYGIFRKQLDKIIEGSGSGISLTDYFNVTSNPFSAFTSDSNGKEMATIAELLVFGFYAIIQFNDKLFSYILSIEKSLSDIAATVTSSSATATNSQIVGSISNGLIDVIAVLDETNVQTAFLSSWVYNQETKPANLMTNIEFNDKDDITAFLASWAYEQETKPVNLKTGIEFNQKDDITAYIASWAYGQQVIPVSASANLGFNLNDPTTALMYNWFFGGGIPTAYASIITTNTIINTVQTVYEEAPPPTPIIRNDYANLASFADGGISYGSLSGYPAMLHGTEAIIPLPNGRTLPVELKSTGNQSAQTDPEIKQLLRILVANQAQDKYLSVDGRQFKIFVQEQADVNRVNANRRAGNETRRIT